MVAEQDTSPLELDQLIRAAFRAGYAAGKADAIDRCCVERLGKEWPDHRTHNIAINLCVAAIRALSVRHAVERWNSRDVPHTQGDAP
jgi:hypothetical protein